MGVGTNRDGGAAVGSAAVVAAFDIGSNSIKMTVGRAGADGRVEEIAVASDTVRLGAGIETSGHLASDRIEAAMAALGRFAANARALGATRLVAVATEATRVAANGPAFLDRVRRETGIEVAAISGDDEADLTFRGLALTTDTCGDLVVVDIGGGSTEVIVARDGVVIGARSLPLGSGRLTDRLVVADPPTATALAACRVAAGAAFDGLPALGITLPSGGITRLVAVGGTGEYLGRIVGPGPIGPSEIERALARLAVTPAATLATELGIPEARARVLPAGVATVAAAADRVRPAWVEPARSGIRAGLLLREFAQLAAERV